MCDNPTFYYCLSKTCLYMFQQGSTMCCIHCVRDLSFKATCFNKEALCAVSTVWETCLSKLHFQQGSTMYCIHCVRDLSFKATCFNKEALCAVSTVWETCLSKLHVSTRKHYVLYPLCERLVFQSYMFQQGSTMYCIHCVRDLSFKATCFNKEALCAVSTVWETCLSKLHVSTRKHYVLYPLCERLVFQSYMFQQGSTMCCIHCVRDLFFKAICFNKKALCAVSTVWETYTQIKGIFCVPEAGKRWDVDKYCV